MLVYKLGSDGEADAMNARLIRVFSFPKDGVFGTSLPDVALPWEPGLAQGCHIDVEPGKFFADEGCASFRAVNIALILKGADVPSPENERF